MPFAPDTPHHEVRIDPPGLSAVLGVPADARGVVIFAHGSGSGRHSPRNNHVAAALRTAGVATLLLDLLTPDEEGDRRNVFDIELLAARLLEALTWTEDQPQTRGRPVGFFGASTGAGAALLAAAMRPNDVAAVVSRGGRPDLAGPSLRDVRAPTLLIVGELDQPVIQLNLQARSQMRSARTELVIVGGAGHLFEEPGTLDQAVAHARAWFLEHFDGAPSREARGDRPPAPLR